MHALDNMHQAESAIQTSEEIRQSVFEMDGELEKARRLHQDFLLHYQEIGFLEAKNIYLNEKESTLANVVTISERLKQLKNNEQTVAHKREREYDLVLYQTIVLRFITTSRELFDLLTVLAAPEAGLVDQLKRLESRIENVMRSSPDTLRQFREIILHQRDYQISRKRSDTQAALNAVFDLYQTLPSSPLTPAEKNEAKRLLAKYEKIAASIPDIDVSINSKLNDFNLQSMTIDPISESLKAHTTADLNVSKANLHEARKLSRLIIYAAALTTLSFILIIGRLIHDSVLSKIVAMTKIVDDVYPKEANTQNNFTILNELDRLSNSFLSMSVRISDLMSNLEELVRLRTMALAESETKYRSVIENITDVFYRTDASGRVTMISPSGVRMLGYSSEEDILWKPADLFWKAKHGRDEMLTILEVRGEVHDYEVSLVHSDGSLVEVSASSRIMRDEHGVVIGVEGTLRDITERKRNENEVKELKDFLSAIINAISDPISVKDEMHRYIYVNSAFCAQVGKTQEYILTNSDRDILTVENLELYHEREKNVLESGIEDISEEAYVGCECLTKVFLTKTSRYITNKGAKYSVSAARDVSTIKMTKDLLKESEKRYRRIVETANEGIIVLDLDRSITYCNDIMCKMLGYDVKELLNLKLFDIIFEEDKYILDAEGQRRRQGIRSRFERRFRCKDNTEIWTIYAGSPIIDEFGEFHGSFAMITDITERKRNQEIHDKIEHMIRHDLRVPASSAIYIAAVLKKDSNLTDSNRKLLDLFEESCQNMLDTLNSSLDLYKIENGRYILCPKQFDCLDVLKKVIDTIRIKTAHTDTSIDLKFISQTDNQEICCKCVGEPHLLRTALQNLLINSVEASEKGGIVSVELSLDSECIIKFRNNGVVPNEIRNRFFEKYVTSGKIGGTGIGTHLAYLLVKTQGGDIIMDTSDENNETVVTVRMPRTPH